MGFDARGERGSRSEPRLSDRRRFLQSVYGMTLGTVLAACGSGDADVFTADEGAGSGLAAGSETSAGGTTPQTLRVQTGDAGAASTVGSEESTTLTDGSSTSSTVAGTETTATPTTDTTSATTSTSTPTSASTSTGGGGAGGGALPNGGTMVVSFTYEPQPGGKNVPPYVAVWIEDGSGNLMVTVALWYQQFGRGERWLPDLTRWYNVDQNRIASGGADIVDAISGPTRSPGSFQVAWDGRIDGSPARAGTYFVCVESARERGPYSLIREAVELNGATRQQSLSSDAELVNASVAVTA